MRYVKTIGIILAIYFAINLYELFTTEPDVFGVIKPSEPLPFHSELYFAYTNREKKYESQSFKFDGIQMVSAKETYLPDIDSFFPSSALQKINGTHNQIVHTEYGQLFFYEKTVIGEIYVYDNWYDQADYWKVFRITNDEQYEYKVPKYGAICSLIDLHISSDSIFLRHHNDETNETTISCLSIKKGTVENYRLNLSDIGISLHSILKEGTFFDPRTKTFVILYEDHANRYIATYCFANNSFESFEGGIKPTHILPTDNGYLVLSVSIASRIRLSEYDLNWCLLNEERLSITDDGERIKGLGKIYDSDGVVRIIDDLLIGAIKGTGKTLVYTIDLQKQEPVMMWQFTMEENMVLRDIVIYDLEGNQPMFFQ